MLQGNIMVFAGLCLDKFKQIDAPKLQRYIMSRDEVGKAVAIEDLEETLDYLNYAKFINVCGKSGKFTVYRK